MATVHVIRHAQASMFTSDYDRLSTLGEQQARELGRALADRLVDAGKSGFDAVFTGPGLRHRDTARLVGEALRGRGLAFPDPIELAGADEHDGQRLVVGALDRGDRDPALAALATSAADVSADLSARSRTWQTVFEAVMRRWLRGQVTVDGHPTWPDFRARVGEAWARVCEVRGEVLLFTSVGPTAAILHQVLAIPVEPAFEIGWRLYNTAITRILHSGSRTTLDGFNEVAHLRAQHWTHR